MTTAKPQLGECVRCSKAGTSASSQPSSWQLQAQHWTLSGLADVGFQTNPANARSCALGAANGHAAFAFGAVFFDRELVRLVFAAGAPWNVASRAWYVAIDASIVVGAMRQCAVCVGDFLSAGLRSRDLIDFIGLQTWMFRVVVVFCEYSGVDVASVGEEAAA